MSRWFVLAVALTGAGAGPLAAQVATGSVLGHVLNATTGWGMVGATSS